MHISGCSKQQDSNFFTLFFFYCFYCCVHFSPLSSLPPLSLSTLVIYWRRVCTCQHTWEDSLNSWFTPSTMWILGTKLKLPVLVASVFTRRAISPNQDYILKDFRFVESGNQKHKNEFHRKWTGKYKRKSTRVQIIIPKYRNCAMVRLKYVVSTVMKERKDSVLKMFVRRHRKGRTGRERWKIR